MESTPRLVLAIVEDLIRQDKSNRTIISLDSLVLLIAEKKFTSISRRWLSRYLRYLIDEGYLTRRSRRVFNDKGQIKSLPSVIKLGPYGFDPMAGKHLRPGPKMRRALRSMECNR